jgi:CheY-like chemotaxis protein
VVEDNSAVQLLIVQQLQRLGYRIIETVDGNQASKVLDSDISIALLFTDIIMPGGMSGRQLAGEARRRRPTLKVLFMSGYAEDVNEHPGGLPSGNHFLQKPFRWRDLARKVRAALDAQP